MLIELRERSCQALLPLVGKRHAAVLPVNGHELGKVIRTLDDTSERLGHQRAMCLMSRHLAHQQQGRVTKLHLLASLDCERRNLLGLDLGHEFCDAARDLDAVVELVLPELAIEHPASQL